LLGDFETAHHRPNRERERRTVIPVGAFT
jgi:hypothetical protein